MISQNTSLAQHSALEDVLQVNSKTSMSKTCLSPSNLKHVLTFSAYKKMELHGNHNAHSP